MDGVGVRLSVIFVLVLSSNAMVFDGESGYSTSSNKILGFIGAITDCSARVGREEKIAMEIAVDDFYTLTGYKLALKLRDSSGNSAQAILTAIDLIKNPLLHAIVSTSTWQEATLVSEMDYSCEVPIISLATTDGRPVATPVKARNVIHMGHNIYVQMRCIAAIIDYFQWRKVTVIYEDRNSYSSDLSIITLFLDVLKRIGVELEHYSAFPVLSSLLDPKTAIQEELKKLTDKESRVFIVVQASLSFAVLLFEQAKEMGMMEKGHVWITSAGITSLIDSFNSSLITSMEGVVGVKDYFSDSAASFKEFKSKFRRRYQAEYPDEEEKSDPSVFALRAYDAIFAIAEMERTPDQKWIPKPLLSNILSSNFQGLSGEIHLMSHRLVQTPTFMILNVLGKSYREMGFWSPKFGFSKNLVKHDITVKARRLTAAEVLDSIYWPGGKTLVPNGLMDSFRPLRVLVPLTNYTEIILHTEQNGTNPYSRFAIDVFEAVTEHLPYEFPYEFVPFDGSYDAMVGEVYHKVGDAAIGDIEITADRCQLVEFTQPYIGSGLVMIVPTKTDNSQEAWMFMKPFTMDMWSLMVGMSVFTGLVVCMIEHTSNSDFRGSLMQQVGKVLWFSFTTLYLGQRESLRHNLSRLVMGPWLFLLLIVSASFTANLASMLTTSRLIPSPIDVGYLQRTNAAVGCHGSSLCQRYLTRVLRFKAENIQGMASIEEHAEALTTGRIKAAFFLSPYAKVFLMKYCKGFTLSGPTYQLGGFGFVFPKGSPYAVDFSQAIRNISEEGNLRQLEDDMLSLLNCSTLLQIGSTGDQSLGPAPFSGLFILSGVVSAIALLITIARSLKTYCQSTGRAESSVGNNGLQLGERTP